MKTDIFKEDIYQLVSDRCGANDFCESTFYYMAANGETYYSTSGLLNITRLDTVNKIVSGKFAFDATTYADVKVRVESGWFDLVCTDYQ